MTRDLKSLTPETFVGILLVGIPFDQVKKDSIEGILVNDRSLIGAPSVSSYLLNYGNSQVFSNNTQDIQPDVVAPVAVNST